MANFKMIKYHKRQYSSNIPITIQEIAGHFDMKSIYPNMPYCLHTEYSFGKRSFSNENLSKYDTLRSANYYGIPLLWYNESWAEQFAHFIIELTQNHRPPEIIEIHPPYKDYMQNIDKFLEIYTAFERILISRYPDVEIFIENRCGTIYKKAPFLISKASDIVELAAKLKSKDLRLRIAFDIPQLYTAEEVTSKSRDKIISLLRDLEPAVDYIASVHLWGKCETPRNKREPHNGDLNTYFLNNDSLKHQFLDSLKNMLSDNKSRYLLLEVNSSNEDVKSIVKDLESKQFIFV